jgi:hypothetical protein
MPEMSDRKFLPIFGDFFSVISGSGEIVSHLILVFLTGKYYIQKLPCLREVTGTTFFSSAKENQKS